MRLPALGAQYSPSSGASEETKTVSPVRSRQLRNSHRCSKRLSSVENSNEMSLSAQRRPLLQSQSMDSSSLSSPSVSHTLHLPFLVLTAHRSDVYELTTVLSDRQSFPPAQFAFELVHFPLLASEAEENLSFFRPFSEVDRIRSLRCTLRLSALLHVESGTTFGVSRSEASPFQTTSSRTLHRSHLNSSMCLHRTIRLWSSR